MSVLCSLPLIASLLSACAPPPPFATGYVEGDYTLIAPVETAQISAVRVVRGDRLEAGAVLVDMAREDAEIALAEADANLAGANSRLADLLEGKRPEEIEVIEANLASARLQAAEAARARDRAIQLADRGVLTDAQRDDAETAANVAAARVAQVAAELAVAKLPARPQAIAQARAAIAGAEAARKRAQWRLDQRRLTLPQPVTIVDVIRQEGEIAGPAAPVLSALADGAVKLRLYIPEPSYAKVAVGDLLAVGCDGCDPGISARISYISDEPEFTPPVIYSLENRQKLVYLIEARPEGEHALKPGQIVNVSLP
ncbi:HlyD family secretion protein [Marimonas arenosa]|uniref:HlyD family efflux transporter periplasmic adaptor subunit n=1 Tax=Marimonas arenosa TaxID=1795305 RepID=A0AAE4B6A9_9RHOB|nr:HlyD family efflux transporter periplasmic adaptor subunit [Marimonas arenosa]MDQ2091144.1 HlyD family efflux transporter periplasmic adaptor subunit [Marimonas arenosa]